MKQSDAPGVYAVLDKDGSLQFVGLSRKVALVGWFSPAVGQAKYFTVFTPQSPENEALGGGINIAKGGAPCQYSLGQRDFY